MAHGLLRRPSTSTTSSSDATETGDGDGDGGDGDGDGDLRACPDIDHDGRDDVAMVGLSTIAAYLSIDDGFGPAQQVACTGNNPRQLAIGDLNNDCVGDVVTVTEAGLCRMMSIPPR